MLVVVVMVVVVVASWAYPFVLVSAAAAPIQYKCSSGCSLDPVIMGAPVEGGDGQVYLNACLAACQVNNNNSLSRFVLLSKTQLSISYICFCCRACMFEKK